MSIGKTSARLAFGLGVAASLGGCASMIQRVAALEDSNILNADSVQGDRQHGNHPNEDAIIRLRGGPAAAENSRQRGRRKDRERFGPMRGEELVASAAAPPAAASAAGVERTTAAAEQSPSANQPCATSTFYCQQLRSEADPPNSALARTYLQAGISLSDELCRAWFVRLGITQTTLRQTSDAISAAGSLSAVLLGLARAPVALTGAAAGALGVAEQATDALTANYVISVDLTTVAAAVQEHRARYAQELERLSEPYNYYTARRAVMAYDDTCSALAVRQFVNERVQNQGRSAGVERLVDTAMAAFLEDARPLFGKAVTEEDILDLYAVLFVEDLDAAVRARLVADLTAKTLFADGRVSFAGASTSADLSSLLRRANLGQEVRTRALARVETVKRSLQAQAATGPRPASTAPATTPSTAQPSTTAPAEPAPGSPPAEQEGAPAPMPVTPSGRPANAPLPAV